MDHRKIKCPGNYWDLQGLGDLGRDQNLRLDRIFENLGPAWSKKSYSYLNGPQNRATKDGRMTDQGDPWTSDCEQRSG